jgi:hypothetical protein
MFIIKPLTPYVEEGIKSITEGLMLQNRDF